MGKLFLLFVLIPIVEISLLISVGEQIGGWNTVAIVIATALIGSYIVRQQGLTTLINAQQKMQQGVAPGQEVAEGLLLVIAGVMLVTPGFITDIIGFLFCLPMTRPLIAKGLLAKLSMQVVGQTQGGFSGQQGSANRSANGDIIEGEFERKDEHKADTERLDKPD
ncbi:FxsA family protein [Paraglaciecola sp. 20A4]|uniref:FxsA family protein n=1 Tax=Paraglaciecola sp. 20A4 TaxID=2687288 RepID=UPI00140CED33|nr:FxsA family protein [Paraglaciecola sp. 20A4]